jgi:cellulose synthase/poly-beta-1,6-N-acetylglucosamine synthase-like glycosyltransferase
MSSLWIAVLAVFPVLDSAYRLVLLLASQWWRRRRSPSWRPSRYLVLVPARGEGANVVATLRSVTSAQGDAELDTVLVLDGEDPEARAAASACGVECVCKADAGPSKGAVLGWVVQTLRDRVEAADAVLVVDVGSTLSERFFDRLVWVDGADGVQAFLSGTGTGPGRSAALSEQIAQRHEDRGREALGWGVRLRGTGFALRGASFLAVADRLVTQVEDLEMSLLLAESGAMAVLGPEDAVVYDVKPERVADAARQRARWLAGQLSLPIHQGRAFLRVLWRRPLEGLSFFGEVAGRPLSLTVPLRILVAVVLGARALDVGWWSPAGVIAIVVGLSAAFDALLNALAAGFRVRSALCMMASWLRAIVLLPRAFLSWMKTR